MGKSDKKVKSEKLNFLRKQYEAFLEEDKKRKERNEYILGRLDEMRSCTTLVTQNKLPQRILNAYQPGPLISTSRTDRSVIPLYSSKHTHPQFKCTTPTPFPVDIPTKTSQEASFLQEIVEKYILIPKSEYYSNSSAAETADWKSKYEILNHLKDIEKDNVPTREDIEFMKTNRNDITLQPLLDELPVKDNLKLKSRQSSCNIKAQTELHNEYDYNSTNLQVAPTGHDEIRSKYIDYDKINNDIISKNPPKLEHKLNEYNTIFTNTRDTRTTESIDILNVASRVQKLAHKHDRSDMISQETTFKQEKEDLVTNKNDTEKIANSGQNNYDYSDTETVNETQLTNQNISLKADDTFIDENEYPIEIINVSDFTPNEEVKLQDGLNVNPDGYKIAASIYNEPGIVNYEGIEPGTIDYDNGSEFSTIQVNYEYNSPQNINNENSADYNDPSTENTSNLEYNEPKTTINDQINLEQVKNLALITQSETEETIEHQNLDENEINNPGQEYNSTKPLSVENSIHEEAIEEFEAEQQDMFYQPQDDNIHTEEGYPENNVEHQYQYYEGAEQVPVEINEHEEATQPYDQNYEAQYGAYQQTGYEQQPAYDQQSQPEQPGYEQQQSVYEQQVYDPQALYNQQEVYDQQPQPEQQGYEQGYYEQQQYDQNKYNQEQNYDQQAYDQLQYEQQTYDNSQGIEEKLDNEQGYAEPNPINQGIEIRNDSEKANEHVVNSNTEVQEGKEQIEAMKNPS